MVTNPLPITRRGGVKKKNKNSQKQRNMINQEFQELKRKWGINSSERAELIKAMKENLFNRNHNNDTYEFKYTSPGKVVSIDKCDVQDLFAVDGDMNPQSI